MRHPGLYTKYQARGLQVIGLSNDEDESPILDFVKQRGVTFPVALDAKQALAGSMQVATTPTTFVFDRKGVQRFRHDGYQEGEAAVLEREIEALLAE